jgi:ferritin-like metal-binding protein YciE
MATTNNTLRELYIDELRDLYDAENRLVKALPKMAKAASSEELRNGIEEHLEQTRGHVERLKQIFTAMGEKPSGKKCPGMMGILEEGEEILDEDYEGALMDAAIISGAQRVEHYEIAAYGCVRSWADLLGENEASSLLQKTLEEEKETDEKLTEMAEQINAEANEESGEEEEMESEGEGEEESERAPARSRARSARAGS